MSDTVYAKPYPPPLSTEVSANELERIAWSLKVEIALPGPEGGWARVVTPRGAKYHAWQGAAA